jgi:hypothetical protein
MFDDTVGSAMLLGLIDLTVVFLVLIAIMGVVYLIKFVVNLRRRPATVAVPELDQHLDAAAKELMVATQVGIEEEEVIAVQAAAIAAAEETTRPMTSASTGISSWRFWARRSGHRSSWK